MFYMPYWESDTRPCHTYIQIIRRYHNIESVAGWQRIEVASQNFMICADLLRVVGLKYQNIYPDLIEVQQESIT